MKYYQFDLLKGLPVGHGVFTRHGGVSKGAFESLNLYGEDAEENLRRVKAALGVDALYFANQCHGKDIMEVKPGVETKIADILTTSERNCPLLIRHADCQAAIIYDPICHAVSAVHSGWKGSVLNVYAEAIRFMERKYGSKPANLLCCISPSLGPNSSEFIHYRTELPESFCDFQFKPNYFNFWEISRFQLQQCGVLPHHIEIAEIDTKTDDDFFSYRRNKVTGRNGTVVFLNKM